MPDVTVTIPGTKFQRVVDAFWLQHNGVETLQTAVEDAGAVQQDQINAAVAWLEIYWADRLRDRVLSYEENQAGLAARAAAEDPMT